MRWSAWPRLAGVGGVIALLLLAVSMPRPPSAPGPDFSEVVEPAAEGQARPSVWYCSWINSGADRSTDVGAAFVPDVDMKHTYPDPRVGEPADEGQFVASGPGAVLQDVADIVNRGDALLRGYDEPEIDGDELLAVGDLWLCESSRLGAPGEGGWRPRWVRAVADEPARD